MLTGTTGDGKTLASLPLHQVWPTLGLQWQAPVEAAALPAVGGGDSGGAGGESAAEGLDPHPAGAGKDAGSTVSPGARPDAGAGESPKAGKGITFQG